MSKRLLFKFSLLIIIVLQTISGSAQFTFEGQLRPRFEFRNGYQKLVPEGSAPAFQISQRSRLSFTYQTDWLRVKVVPQDVRIWGDEQNANTSGVFGDAASLDLHEAYAEIRLLPMASVILGRQELTYDNQSILSNRNWNQNGTAADLLLLRMKAGKWYLHLAGGWNTQKETGTNHYFLSDRLKSLNYIWLNRNFSKGLTLSLLHIASGVTENDSSNLVRFRQTTGFYSGYYFRYFSANTNLYYQYGINKKGNRVSAWMADGEARRVFGKFIPSVGFGYLSGNTAIPGADDTDHLFDDIYRSKHKFFGFLDYFSNMPTQTAQGGLMDLYGALEYRMNGSLSVKNTGHWFSLAALNPATPAQPELGYENDLVLSYRQRNLVNWELGYLFFLPTGNLKELQGVPTAKTAHYVYLMLTITPVFFKN
jgi:hypothetical protein